MSDSKLLTLLLILIVPHGFYVESQHQPPARFEDAVKDLVDKWDRQHAVTTYPEDELLDEPGNVTENAFSYPNSGEELASSAIKNCTRCVPHEEARALRLSVIKAQILDKLRMQQAPNMTRKMMLSLPPVNQIVEKLNGVRVGHHDSEMMGDSPSDLAFPSDPEDFEDVEEYHLHTEKVISVAQKPPAGWQHSKYIGSVFFNFAPNLFTYDVGQAELWVRVETTPVDLFVYQVFSTGKSKQRKVERNALHSVYEKKITSDMVKDGWFKIDIRKTVANWFRKPKDNLGLVIHLNDQEGRQIPVFEPENPDRPVPLMEVHLKPKKNSRKKRSLSMTCRENSKEVKCCRYPLTVDFEEFGWNWVIAPKRYEANYCSGECPYVFLQSYQHTHILSQINPEGSTGPCCAPKKLSPISMLFYSPSQGNYVLGMLPNMVVEECGCN